MNDRTGQVWAAERGDSWQMFLVLREPKHYHNSRVFEHLRLILASNWPTWPGKVAPYAESVDHAWERNPYFQRIL